MLSREEIKNFKIDPMIELCYDYVFPISMDRILATHGGEISLIDNDGEMLCTYDSIEVPMYYDEEYEVKESQDIEEFVGIPKYIDDVLMMLEDGLWGLTDYDGNVIIEPMYKVIHFLNNENFEGLL